MLTRRTRNRRLCLAALAAVAPLQLLAVAVRADAPDEGSQDVDAFDAPVVVRAPVPAQEPAVPLQPAFVTAAPAPTPPVQLVTEPEAAPAAAAPVSGPTSAPERTFAERYPAQAAATQDPGDPASTRWALLIGINEYRGGVADNVGSRQDAEDLRTQLLASGWRDDHILLLTDRRATRADIVAGIAWLAEKTDERSVAVFHYSGHSKKWYGRDIDGDGEITDEGLWPSDGRFIVDSELVRLLDPVRPHAMWLSFATCNAAGFADPGMARPGRILTFSSGEPQKSYENPAWSNSVWGWFLFEQAFAAGLGDTDGDGRVTVEEAFTWARPRARETTSGQRYGPQDGVMVDNVPGAFDLLVPGAPRPERQVASAPQADQPAPEQPQGQPAPAPAPEGGEQQPPPERSEENHGNRICVLCGR